MSRIVGAADTKTRNKVILQTGQEAYLCCGADILLTGLYHNLEGEAICPVCENKIHVSIKDKRIVSVSPRSALLHYVREAMRDPSKSGIRCSVTFIFDKEPCLKSWLKSRKGSLGKISSPQDFMNEARSCGK